MTVIVQPLTFTNASSMQSMAPYIIRIPMKYVLLNQYMVKFVGLILPLRDSSHVFENFLCDQKTDSGHKFMT